MEMLQLVGPAKFPAAAHRLESDGVRRRSELHGTVPNGGGEREFGMIVSLCVKEMEFSGRRRRNIDGGRGILVLSLIKNIGYLSS